MKKFLSVFLAILMFISASVPAQAFAENGEEYNCELTQEELDALEFVGEDSIQTFASGLIVNTGLAVGRDGYNLIITGFTRGTSSVVKCGFKEVTVQRKKPNGSNWFDVQTFSDLYTDATYYSFAKSVPAESGYVYRAVATHYAKKSLLSTQKIEATSGTVQF